MILNIKFMDINIHYIKQISSINRRMELNIHSHLLVKLWCLMKSMRKLRNKLQIHVDIQICCITFSHLISGFAFHYIHVKRESK